MDLFIFRQINSLAGWWPLLDMVMIGLAEAIVPVAMGLLLLFWFLPGRGQKSRRRAAVMAGLGALLALGTSDIPTYFYSRPRPFEAHRVTKLINPPLSPSFPSTHAAMAGAVFTILGPRLGRWQYAAWALAIGSTFARVYAGVHYPGDILAGLALGWVTGAVIHGNRDALAPFADRLIAGAEELL